MLRDSVKTVLIRKRLKLILDQFKLTSVNYLGASFLPTKAGSRYSLETNFQCRGKPRGIKPFGGTNKNAT